MDNYNNTYQSKKQDKFFLRTIIERKNDVKKEIEEAKEPEYLLSLPILVADSSSSLNMILADSGMGKSVFNRCLVGSLIDNEDFIILYFDLEYIPSISKERKFNELLEKDNFYLIRLTDINEIKERTNLRTTSRIVYRIIKEFTEHYSDKKLIVLVDSFEDLIEDTSNDAELKRVLYDLLSLQRTTFLISHHISKDNLRQSGMRFRGSMVIKAKVSSMLYLTKKIKENDFEELFEFEILKIRAAYKPVKKLSVRLDLNKFSVKDIITTSDTEEIRVLKEAYFILKKETTLTKSNLIKAISEKLKKHKDKIREIIDSNKSLFDIEKGDRRTEYYSLTTDKAKLDEYLAIIGLGDSSLSDVKQELLEELEDIDDDKELNIEVKDEKDTLIIYKSKRTIRLNIYKMSDFVASEILRKLRELKRLEEDELEPVDF